MDTYNCVYCVAMCSHELFYLHSHVYQEDLRIISSEPSFLWASSITSLKTMPDFLVILAWKRHRKKGDIIDIKVWPLCSFVSCGTSGPKLPMIDEGLLRSHHLHFEGGLLGILESSGVRNNSLIFVCVGIVHYVYMNM